MAFKLLITVLKFLGLLSNIGDNPLSNCNQSESKLMAVSMLFRHGDRAPASNYPLDPHKDYPWPGGLGALSPRGAKQLYQSGLLKSTRYSSLLSVICANGDCTLDLDNIHVISSSVERCIDSAHNFLDGFLRVEWPANMINVVPAKDDKMIVDDGKPCPKYPNTNFGELTYDDPRFKKIIDINSAEGRRFFTLFYNNTGMDPTLSPLIPFLVQDNLLIQRDNELRWRTWARRSYDKYLLPIATIAFDQIAGRKIAMLRTGVLLKDMIDRLESSISGTSEQNLLIYSAHDTTVAGLLKVLEVQEQAVLRPDYGSMLSMELYDNEKIRNDLEIKLFYSFNYGDTNPKELKIPKCKSPCPFSKFKSTVQSKLTVDYDAACAA